MTIKRKPYKTFTKEFKLEAVRLMDESDRPSSEKSLDRHSVGIFLQTHQIFATDNFD